MDYRLDHPLYLSTLFIQTLIVVILDSVARSHRSYRWHRVFVGLFGRGRPLSFLCWGRHNVKDKWLA